MQFGNFKKKCLNWLNIIDSVLICKLIDTKKMLVVKN